MKLLLALRDVKTGAFLPPFTATTPGEAERTYREIMAQQNIVGKYPHDFPLYEVGKFDELSGEVYPVVSETGVVAPPRLLLEAGQLIQLAKEG